MWQEVAAGVRELLGLQKLCDPLTSYRCHLDSVCSVFPVFGVSVAAQALKPWFLGTGNATCPSQDEGRCGGAVRHCQPLQYPGCPSAAAGCSTSGTGGTSLLEMWGTGISGQDHEKLWWPDWRDEKGSLGHPGGKFGAGKKEQLMGALWVHCRGMGDVSVGWGEWAV